MVRKSFVKERAIECSKLVILIMGSAILGTIVMIFLYSIPVDWISEHAQESLPLYSTEMIGNWSGHGAYADLSNYTDSIMINNALYRPYERTVDNAMLNSYIKYHGVGMTDNLTILLVENRGGANR